MLCYNYTKGVTCLKQAGKQAGCLYLVFYQKNDLGGIRSMGGGIMKELSIREARQALSHLDRLLEKEGEVVLTRRGKVIARVVGFDQVRPIPSHKSLRRKMALLRKGSERLVREDRDAR